MKAALSAFILFVFVFANNTYATEIPEWDIKKLKSKGIPSFWTFEITNNWVTDYLSKGGDIKNITGLEEPKSWRRGATFYDIKPRKDLPVSYDWKEVSGGLQPIRNQGSCGSCWAFSVTAVLESLIMIANPKGEVPDLAEQTLVSRCSGSGSCFGGYFSAFNYLKSPGLPKEEQDPYKASNSWCKSDLEPVANIASWAYVGDGSSSPTTEQIKTAIYKYGPVSVDVNASFGSYSSGVYNNCNTRSTNHMVTLEGWNEEGQYWIMRNSWGSSWGEDGYMKIKYTSSSGKKCNNIGRVAAFAVLNPGVVKK